MPTEYTLLYLLLPKECIWLRQLEAELAEAPTLIFEDDQSTIAMAKNP